MFNRLQTKLLCIIFFGLTLTVGINYIINNRFLKKELLSSISGQAFSNGENLKSQIQRLLGYGLPLDEITGFDVICMDLLKNDKNITYAMTTDLEGNILFHSSNDAKTHVPSNSTLYKAIHKKERSIEKLIWNDHTYFFFVVPLLNIYGQHVGAVTLCYPEQAIYGPTKTMSMLTLIASIIMLLIEMCVAALAIYLWVTKPLDRLYYATREVFFKGTNGINKVEVTSKDEIGKLANSFNVMLGHLKKSTVSKDFLDNIISSITDALIVIDNNQNITMVNEATCTLLGYSEEELIGKPGSVIWETNEDFFPSGRCYTLLHKYGELKNEEVEVHTKSNEVIPMLFCCSIMNTPDPSVYHIVCTGRDIRPIKKADELIVFQANHDMLTGLANRYFLEKEITKLITDSKASHTFLYLDLDKFKVVNDVCGHHAGDQLLKNLASLMKYNLRSDDLIARIGGDEFAMLLRNTPIEEGYLVGERLCKVVKEFHFSWDDKLFTLGVSIGAVEINESTPSSEWLLSVADQTCYLSKQRGGNSLQVFTSDDKDFSMQHQQLDIMPSITTALAENRFFLQYQPIISISNTKSMEWHEVLLRMKDLNNKILYPNMFLTAAQRYNILPAIDRWVISHFFSNYHKMIMEYDIHKPYLFNINISGASLNTNDFFDFICTERALYDIPANTICFEITETSFISNFANTSEFISKLKSIGFLFALDDFGTGLSSFSYLKYLPVDFLKIDGEFIRDIVNNQIDYAMVSSINEIAHLMGKQTIAEYVENIEIVNCLKEIGVDFVQGYAIGKPTSIGKAHTKFMHITKETSINF